MKGVCAILTLFVASCARMSINDATSESQSGSMPAVEPADLRCEYETDPVGIDAVEPRLSWRLESAASAVSQSAYRIKVSSSRRLLNEGKADVWDSGKVLSGRSQYVPYAGPALESEHAYYWSVRVWDQEDRPSGWSPLARWVTGLLQAEDWQAAWIGPVQTASIPEPVAAPYFRKDFSLDQAPAAAYITMHSPAYFEVYINGSKVGTDVLTPAVSDQDKRSFSVTDDIGALLRKGPNCIGVWTGIGWAEQITFRAQLTAEVSGERLTIGTDESWKTHPSGRYRIGGRKWNNNGGERVDGRERFPGWCDPDIDTEAWEHARVMEDPGGVVRNLPCPANVVGQEIPAVSVREVTNGTYEVDFGTALTGWFRMAMRELAPGAKVTMTFADAKNNKPQKRSSRFGEDDYQHYNQICEYLAAGAGEEVFESRFNYAGFRYVVVEGLQTPPQIDDFTAKLIESDLEPAGSFECSNELFNHIHRVNRWTQRCLNLGGYYVDCPTRERWGYGDGQVAAEGFMSNFRADGFYRKWLGDWRNGQQADGSLKNTAPWGNGGGGPGWGGLLSAITWRHYLYYGDVRILEENYDAIRRYADHLESKCTDNVLRKFGGQWDFIGDWVPPGRGMDTGNWPGIHAAELFNNCYRIRQMDLLRQMAEVLGRTEDANRYGTRLAEIRPIVHAAFYDANAGHYGIDEQAYYVMPLMAGVVPESLEATMLEKLEANILEKNNGHLDTGMLGTYFMMEYLREIGRSDLVFTMFSQTTHPGWGHMLEQGATTFWEQWNGWWSRIHSCFTSPDNWFYQGLGGIQADPDAPGFKNVIIRPAIVGDVTWVKSHHDSPYGRIVSNWKREGGKLTMEVSVPVNSTATVYVPAGKPDSVLANGKPLVNMKQAQFLGMEDGCAVVRLASGRYTFSTELHNSID